jgi:hypothetical protein
MKSLVFYGPEGAAVHFQGLSGTIAVGDKSGATAKRYLLNAGLPMPDPVAIQCAGGVLRHVDTLPVPATSLHVFVTPPFAIGRTRVTSDGVFYQDGSRVEKPSSGRQEQFFVSLEVTAADGKPTVFFAWFVGKRGASTVEIVDGNAVLVRATFQAGAFDRSRLDKVSEQKHLRLRNYIARPFSNICVGDVVSFGFRTDELRDTASVALRVT